MLPYGSRLLESTVTGKHGSAAEKLRGAEAESLHIEAERHNGTGTSLLKPQSPPPTAPPPPPTPRPPPSPSQTIPPMESKYSNIGDYGVHFHSNTTMTDVPSQESSGTDEGCLVQALLVPKEEMLEVGKEGESSVAVD